MRVYCYDGIDKQAIDSLRYTKEGKEFNLNHSDELLVPMRFKGSEKSNTNSQGWERSGKYYFKEIAEKHPEYFSKRNIKRIQKGKVPFVDDEFIEYFPEYKDYKNEMLIHHHIGGDGQGVAIPKSMHDGYGVIHSEEKALGIRDNAEKFSSQCASIAKNHTEMNGKLLVILRNTFLITR